MHEEQQQYDHTTSSMDKNDHNTNAPRPAIWRHNDANKIKEHHNNTSTMMVQNHLQKK